MDVIFICNQISNTKSEIQKVENEIKSTLKEITELEATRKSLMWEINVYQPSSQNNNNLNSSKENIHDTL